MTTSIGKCREEEQESLISFLKQDLYYHTFMLADIYYYGFDQPCQQIYAEKADGKVKSVFLKYYTNLILAGDPGEEACLKIRELYREQISTVMGKAELVKRFAKCGRGMEEMPVTKKLYILNHQKKLDPGGKTVYTAEENEADKVHSFLMTVPGFQSLYGEKEMIRNRIRNQEGEHLYYQEGEEIIAHANTAAATPWACMIGGVSVKQPYQHRGIGHKIVSAAAKRALDSGRIPGVFSEWPQEQNLFCDLGFQEIGDWGVLNLKKNNM